MINWQQTVYSQYSTAQVITALIASFNDSMDPSAVISTFYNVMLNVLTAQGYGLDVWGRIVGVTRVQQIPGGQRYFGFKEQTNTTDPYGVSPFYTGTPASQSYALTDPAFRLLILAKALANISRASIPIYNAILRQLFPGRGNCYVSDTGAMIERLTFEFALQPFEISVIKASSAVQAPTGVGFVVMSVPLPPTPGGTGGTFGFAEAGYSASPYNCGTYFTGFL